MGLFSKLFSREGEDPTQSEGQDAQAAASGGEGVTKGEESVAAGGGAKDARARSATSPDKAEPAPPAAAGDKSARGRAETPPAGAAVKPPPAEAAATAAAKGGGPIRKPEPGKPAAPVKPPAALGSAGISGRSPGAQTGSSESSDAHKQVTSARKPGVQVKPPPEQIKGKRPPPPAAGDAGADEKTTPLTTSGSSSAHVVPPLPAASAAAAAQNNATPLEAAVDAALNALMAPQASPENDINADNAHDQRAVAETFADMAKVHAHPLRELMFQLSVGRTPKQWAGACRPVLRPLFDAATQIGLLELVGALGAFDAALERAAAEPTPTIGDAAVEALTGAYERLRQQMPDAFTQPDRADSRRMILLESLLLQVPDLQRRTLAKLYAAGVSSLAQLSQAQPDELSAVAGIDRDLAHAIVAHVQRFEKERNRINPSAMRAHIQERLRSIIGRLNQLQAEFEAAELAESNERKRTARRGREAVVLELDLLFAEVGDVDLIEQLKRCPVRDKIRRVESYLEQLQTSA